MTHTIRELPDDQRFELLEDDGQLAALVTYTRDGDVVSLNHTETKPGFEGQGRAGVLVEHILGVARAQGWQIVPECPYVAHYLKKHPEHTSLVPAQLRGDYDLSA